VCLPLWQAAWQAQVLEIPVLRCGVLWHLQEVVEAEATLEAVVLVVLAETATLGQVVEVAALGVR
jgi:hypothetical protein